MVIHTVPCTAKSFWQSASISSARTKRGAAEATSVRADGKRQLGRGAAEAATCFLRVYDEFEWH